MNSGTVFGNKIATIRKRMGLTQSDLADKVGVSRVAISQFEKGINRPSPDTLSKLSQVLEEELTIGRFPLAGIDNNIVVPIIVGNQYNRLKWDYLRRNESDVPTKEEEEAYGMSNTSYAYESLSLPPIILKPGVTRAFPMPGNSMEPSFGDGDLIIATQLQNIDWSAFPKESNSYEVIDTLPMCVVEVETKKERSIEFGRCGVDATIKSLYCFSDRRGFMPYRIGLESIKAIWEFKCFLSQRSQNPAQQLTYRADALERELNEIKKEAKRYPRLKILLRQMVLELDTSDDKLRWDFSDYIYDSKVRELYELEVGPIVDDNKFADKLISILQPLIAELTPTLEEDRRKKQLELERERAIRKPGEPPYMPGPLPGPRQPQ
jgi:transcriptional regulator with XRE-family HTH domain